MKNTDKQAIEAVEEKLEANNSDTSANKEESKANEKDKKDKKKKVKEPYTLIDKLFLIAGLAIMFSIVALMLTLMFKFNITPKSIAENITGKNRTNVAETIDRTIVDKSPTLEEILDSGEAEAIKVTILSKDSQGLADGTDKEKFRMTFNLDTESSQTVKKTIVFNVSDEDFRKYNVNDEVIIVVRKTETNGTESMQYYGILEAVKTQASNTTDESKANKEEQTTLAELREGTLNLSNEPYTKESKSN